MTKKKVLVTGAGGFIGSHLTEKLSASGYKVKAFVHYNSRNSWGWLESSRCKNRIEIISGDIRDADIVRDAMRDVETVFHLAALIGIPYSYHSPEAYVETNIRGSLNILQAAKDSDVKKVVHTSTSEIYGTAQFVPITENHPINPQSPYAATKSAADLLALSFYRSFDLPVAVVRPFNTYGPRQSARAVIPTIITQILYGGKKIKLGALAPTRDLTYVEDTVDGFIRAGECRRAVGEVINLGSNSEISIGDLARLISLSLHRDVTIDSALERKRPEKSEVERLLADNAKARRLLGWSPKYSLEKGLLKTIAWFKENKDIYKSGIYNV
nr:NAD-dependent 4,6-dehydratase LegB [Candidatus Omnitrophota bacterium]MDD5310552.1 NAD-dependent 4,6-dehydratase LegB [Candidatus Omnitrophota bacterium]MDD5546022.1 NAD-dependent 4,6-dehydratase LegB [Candidatus Omnitrophota bacterium]